MSKGSYTHPSTHIIPCKQWRVISLLSVIEREWELLQGNMGMQAEVIEVIDRVILYMLPKSNMLELTAE